MAYNYSKLRGKIKEVFLTQERFAQAIGMGNVSLSNRLNNKSKFTQSEILKACNVLGIDGRDIVDYFFNQEVQKR